VSPAHDIARLVRRGLAEVCTVPELVVFCMRFSVKQFAVSQSGAAAGGGSVARTPFGNRADPVILSGWWGAPRTP